MNTDETELSLTRIESAGNYKTMFKIIQIFSLLSMIMFSLNTVADSTVGTWGIDCGPATVKAIQTQKNEVLVLLENTEANWTVWKGLGKRSDNFIDSYQAVVQQAMAQQKKIILRLPITDKCNTTDYYTSPFMVRIINY